MKVQYKKGPCKNARCCPKGDTHGRVVELQGGARFVRGGDAVELDDKTGTKLIADHPGMFEKVGGKAPAKKSVEAKK